MSIKISPDYIKTVKDSVAADKVSLPFKAPSFWWKNGEAGRPTDRSGAEHFGGWAANSDDFTANVVGDIPAKFVAETWINNKGEKYDVFATRHLSVAIFASRNRWLTPEETQTAKGYGNTQWLAFVGLYNNTDKTYAPWGPVVLTATSTKAMLIKNAIVRFDKLTASLRATYAGNAPIGFFYATLGTFGERYTTSVGKGANTSQVTPCQLRAPEQMTEEAQLEALYVGDEVAKGINDLALLAKEWLEEWKHPSHGGKKSETPPEPDEPQSDEPQYQDLPPM